MTSTTERTARFWTLGPGCSPVKIGLRPGESLSHSHAWDNGEGWSRAAQTWTHEGERITREVYTSANDCDGRHSSEETQACAIDRLAHYADTDGGGERWPAWGEARGSQWDQFAEAAGY